MEEERWIVYWIPWWLPNCYTQSYWRCRWKMTEDIAQTLCAPSPTLCEHIFPKTFHNFTDGWNELLKWRPVDRIYPEDSLPPPLRPPSPSPRSPYYREDRGREVMSSRKGWPLLRGRVPHWATGTPSFEHFQWGRINYPMDGMRRRTTCLLSPLPFSLDAVFRFTVNIGRSELCIFSLQFIIFFYLGTIKLQNSEKRCMSWILETNSEIRPQSARRNELF